MEEKTFYFASIGRRFVAFLLDGIILGVITFPLNWGLNGFVLDENPLAAEALTQVYDPRVVFTTFSLVLVVGMALQALYYTWFIGHLGQTPGKMLLRIKVVNPAGEVPGYGRALVRFLIAAVISPIFFLGYIWAFFHPRRQTWHDLAANTYVVKAD